MKKLSVLIALVLLAVAGTGYAVTCAYDNVPAATLLVPYWKVSLNGATGYPIGSGGTDTLVSVVNVSSPGVIAHVTVWNKYSKAVIDFNLPLTGKDVVSFSMRDILNGKLSPNLPQYDTVKYPKDPCGITNPGLPNVGYAPKVGFGQTSFIRFSHPDAASTTMGIDVVTSISQYNINGVVDAIGPGFRPSVWNSLDESGDITTFTNPAAGNILDKDNPACGWAASAPLKDALSGYLTIDVVNYCTNFFPDQADFYNKDAIATLGWGPTYTPNVFFGEFVAAIAGPACAGEITPFGCQNPNVPAAYYFGGDGREPLGDRYGFHYLADQANGLQSWIIVWRSDYYQGANVNLCAWADPTAKTGNNGDPDTGLYDSVHQVQVLTYDNDENLFGGVGVPPGPSGQLPGTSSPNYIFLESQRINLLTATDWNPANFKGGWVDLTLRGPGYTGADASHGLYNMGWVGVQHTAPGQFVSVGYAAANLDNQFQCSPNFQGTGTVVTNIQ